MNMDDNFVWLYFGRKTDTVACLMGEGRGGMVN